MREAEPSDARRGSLATEFDPRNNAIGFLRLALAILVIVGHTWPIGGFGGGPLSRWSRGDVGFGSLAVTGFFVLSGFLIARSLLENPRLGRYLWHRSLRILPGFWAALLVTAVLFGPLFWLLGGGSIGSYFEIAPNGAGSYISKNWLLAVNQGTIDHVLSGVPFKDAINGSLWTLVIEFKCYLALAALGMIAAKRQFRMVLPLAALVLWLVQLWWLAVPSAAVAIPLLGGAEPLRLSIDFFVGTSFYVFRDRIPIDGRLAILAFLAFMLTVPFGSYRLVGGITVAYAMLWLACRLPIRSFDRRADFSYGTYLYAFPVMQGLVLIGASVLGPFGFMLLSTALTIPLAAFSWYMVERSAMRFRNLQPAVALAARRRDPRWEPMAATLRRVTRRGGEETP